MAKHRFAPILASETATTAATKTINLDLTDIISRLSIRYISTPSNYTPVAHPAKIISKVEIVDGSDVLFSLSGQQLEALMFFETMKERFYFMSYYSGYDNYAMYDIYFGRFLYDKLLAFDPTKFGNPQLKITHNIASGGPTNSASTLRVWADVFDEVQPTPRGYLMSKEYYAFTAGASAAYESIDIPNDHPIRRILLQSQKTQSWWENNITEVRVDEENLKKVVFDAAAADIMYQAMTKYGLYHENFIGSKAGSGNATFYITPHDEATCTVIPVAGEARHIQQASEYPCGGEVVTYWDGGTTGRFHVAGSIPHGIVPLDFGDLSDLNDWYDVTQKKNVKLRLKANNSADVKVSLQQFRRY